MLNLRHFADADVVCQVHVQNLREAHSEEQHEAARGGPLPHTGGVRGVLRAAPPARQEGDRGVPRVPGARL